MNVCLRRQPDRFGILDYRNIGPVTPRYLVKFRKIIASSTISQKDADSIKRLSDENFESCLEFYCAGLGLYNIGNLKTGDLKILSTAIDLKVFSSRGIGAGKNNVDEIIGKNSLGSIKDLKEYILAQKSIEEQESEAGTVVEGTRYKSGNIIESTRFRDIK